MDLREKGWLERLETGYLALTVDGVDQVERYRVQLAPERLIETRAAPDGSGAASSDAPAKPSAP